MATIRKRNNKWQAQVRHRNAGAVSKTFTRRCDALDWSREQEIKMEKGTYGCLLPEQVTLRELLERYLNEVTPRKRGRARERARVRRLMTEDICSSHVSSLDTRTLTAFRDRRLMDGIRACQYDLVIISHCLKTAKLEWGLRIDDNPVSHISKPASPPSRERRLNPGEFDRIKEAALNLNHALVLPCIELAIETAMRKSELTSLKWCDVSLEERTAYLAMTKNGHSRTIPLSPRAIEIIDALPKGHERILPLTENTLRLSWDHIRRHSGVEGLRFHDLRHEAISRLFERGLSVAEVALISGHKDPRMLFRYVQLRPEDIAHKLGDWVPCHQK